MPSRDFRLSNPPVAEYDSPRIRMATGKSKNSEAIVTYQGSNGGVSGEVRLEQDQKQVEANA